jgi:SAM-dependent methyltransferase
MISPLPHVLCPNCAANLVPAGVAVDSTESAVWRCAACGFVAPGNSTYVALESADGDSTSDHYSIQWGIELGFLDFIKTQPKAKSVMPAAQLGWDRLFREIRAEAAKRPVWVYDAACGFGGIANEIVDDSTRTYLRYVGADIHGSLPGIIDRIPALEDCGLLLRWDISNPLPLNQEFDFVMCRASLHHTPDPSKSFESICRALKPGGRIAISVYNKKGVCREACDDALRAIVSPMESGEAFEVCRQFTVLGQVLQQVAERVSIPEDLPLLGISKGEYGVQELVYYHLLKCFYNAEFGDERSTLVNFDWYHPPFAFRYSREEVEAWFERAGLRVVESVSIGVQHYFLAEKPL